MRDPLDPRKRRMSLEDVEDAMVSTAVKMVNERGLTVSLQHIPLDYIAATAGVARSAVYRIWENRDDFFDRLLLELASKPGSSPLVFDPDTLTTAIETLKTHLRNTPELLDDEEMRRFILVEMCRTGATRNYENIMHRGPARNYIAVTATALSFDEPMKSELLGRIDTNKAHYVEGMAKFYDMTGELLGWRARPEFHVADPDNPKTMRIASAGAAVMEGMILSSISGSHKGLALPDLLSPAVESNPFGVRIANVEIKSEWSAPAIAFTATFLAMVEPVPQEEYDSSETTVWQRIEAIEAFIATLPSPTGK